MVADTEGWRMKKGMDLRPTDYPHFISHYTLSILEIYHAPLQTIKMFFIIHIGPTYGVYAKSFLRVDFRRITHSDLFFTSFVTRLFYFKF